MKRTAAVLLVSLFIVFYTMSYMRINAVGAEETTAPTEEMSSDSTVPETVPDPAVTTKIVDIPKPTTEPETETPPETTEPVTEETAAEITVTETETDPVPDETTRPAAEVTSGSGTETEHETVPPPETIEQETRAPEIVLHVLKDKVLAQVTVAVNPPVTVKPVSPAVTVAGIIKPVTETSAVITAVSETAAEEEITAADDLTVLTSPVTVSDEDTAADSPGLTAGSVAVIGTGAAAITALLCVLRFAKRP